MIPATISVGKNAAGRARDLRIQQAAQHPIIAIVPRGLVEEKFDLTAIAARAAQHRAEKTARKNGTWAKIEAMSRQDRLTRSIYEVVGKYEKMLTLIFVRKERVIPLCEKFGITKARGYQIINMVKEASALLNLPPEQVAMLAEKRKLPPLAVDVFDKIPSVRRQPQANS